MNNLLCTYFLKLFSLDHAPNYNSDFEYLQFLSHTVSEEDNDKLLQPFLETEVFEAI